MDMTSEQKMSNLLKVLGNPGQCGSGSRPGCGAGIWWVQTKAGKAMPLNSDGTPHWATCPNAREFKREHARVTPGDYRSKKTS